MNSNLKGPLNPQELFQRLMARDFREAECVQEASNFQQQREILIQLIVEYEAEIENVRRSALEEQELLHYREKLMMELEVLRNERGAIEARLSEEAEAIRLTPIEMKDQASLTIEIDVTRTRNNKLKIKIRDLMGYISKLQFQNQRLQEERRIVASNDAQRRQVGENWRAQIEFLQSHSLSYEQELRRKIKEKQEMALRSIQTQEFQIRERNRKRMQSFKNSETSTPYNKIDDRQPFQSKYYRQI